MKFILTLLLACSLSITTVAPLGAEEQKAHESAATAPLPATSPTARTIARKYDIVSLKGEELPGVLGSAIERIRVFRYAGGAFEAIPFQADKVCADGYFWISEKDEKRLIDDREDLYDEVKNKWSEKDLQRLKAGFDKKEDLKHFDENDELVLLVSDLGDRAEEGRRPEGSAALVEVSVTDPVDGSRGWAYVVSYEKTDPPPPAARSYMRCDTKNAVVESQAMIVDFKDDNPMILENLTAKKKGGKQESKILDRFKFRLKAKTKLYITINFDEENVGSKVIGYKIGPVRIIRRMMMYFKVFIFKVPTTTVIVDNIFYPYSMSNPSVIKVPMNPSTMLREGSELVIGMDMLKRMYGMSVTTKGNIKPLVYDGRIDDYEEDYMKMNQEYMCVVPADKQSTFLLRFNLDENLKKLGLTVDFRYFDDPDFEWEPENEPGALFFGARMDLLKFRKGKYQMNILQWGAPEWSPNICRDLLRIKDRLIEIETRRL